MMVNAYRVAFQLYSSRNFPPLEAQLEGLAELGYDGVEPFLPNYGDDPAGFRRRIDDAGLACYGFHLPYDGLIADPDRFIDIAHTIGAGLLIPPYLPEENRPTSPEGWRAIGRSLAAVAERVNAEGLRLAWHNHDFEYRALPDGTLPIDHLFDAAGPNVGYEIDFAWVTRGGGDPLREMKKYAKRMFAIQVKDTLPLGEKAEGGWAAMGDGIVDWQGLWPLFAEAPADHLVVEHDEPLDWRRVAARSLAFIRKLQANAQNVE
jgi:sugar phosphate isomerase/epimerase